MSKGVYACPEFLTFSLSLSFGCVADWREQFFADVEYLSRSPDRLDYRDLARFVWTMLWPERLAEVRLGCSFILIKLPFCV